MYVYVCMQEMNIGLPHAIVESLIQMFFEA